MFFLILVILVKPRKLKETIEEKTQSSSDEINSHSNTQKKTMIIL